MAGTLDVPTGLRIAGQIHTAAASDYYSFYPEAPAWTGAPGSPATTVVDGATDSEE